MNMTTRRLFAALAALGLAASADAGSRAPTIYLKMPWDKVVEAAKAEGELTFYAWWGEEFWRTAAKDFEAKYGIKVNVVTGDRAGQHRQGGGRGVERRPAPSTRCWSAAWS